METHPQQSTAEFLISQIGQYPHDASQTTPSIFNAIQDHAKSLEALYQGTTPRPSPKTAREAFIRHVAQCNEEKNVHFQGDRLARERDPTSATVSMASLLGPEGSILYVAALKEEINSEEYMDALVINASTHYPGAPCTPRMAMIIAGPSASGKTYAAASAIAQATASESQDLSGNDFLAIDGGIVRETSQMRRLAIQLALNRGYTGIHDLSSCGKNFLSRTVLDKAKDRLYQAGTLSPNTNLVIPETFTRPFPLLVTNLMQLPETQVVFARVTGEDEKDRTVSPQVFQARVASMGKKRAFKSIRTSDPEPKGTLDLNATQLPESKAYDDAYFDRGVSQSRSAENTYRNAYNTGWWGTRRVEKPKVINIVNDLKSYVENNGFLVEVGDDEPNARLMSKKIAEQRNAQYQAVLSRQSNIREEIRNLNPTPPSPFSPT